MSATRPMRTVEAIFAEGGTVRLTPAASRIFSFLDGAGRGKLWSFSALCVEVDRRIACEPHDSAKHRIWEERMKVADEQARAALVELETLGLAEQRERRRLLDGTPAGMGWGRTYNARVSYRLVTEEA